MGQNPAEPLDGTSVDDTPASGTPQPATGTALSPEVTWLPPAEQESIPREACSLAKLDARRCSVPSASPCVPTPSLPVWTDFDGRHFFGARTEPCVDYRCSLAIMQVDGEDGLGVPEVLPPEAVGYLGWISGVRRGLAWMPEGEGPNQSYCFELPPWDDIPLEGAKPWYTSLEAGVDEYFFPDECGDLHYLVSVDQTLVALSVVAGQWQVHTLGPLRLLSNVALSTRFEHPTAQPDPELEQRAVVSWVGSDGGVWFATYSTTTGWTPSVQIVDSGVLYFTSVHSAGRAERKLQGTASGITLDGQAYALWVTANEDATASMWIVLIDADGVPGDPQRLEYPVTIMRPYSGPDELHYTAPGSDGEPQPWLLPVDLDGVGEPKPTEPGRETQWSFARPPDVSEGSLSANQTEISTRAEGPFSRVYLFEYGPEGDKTEVGTVSDPDGDAVLGFVALHPAGGAIATWSQWEGYRWPNGQQCRTVFISDEAGSAPIVSQECLPGEPPQSTHTAIITADHAVLPVPACSR